MKNFAWKQILVTFAISFVLGAFIGRWEFSHCIKPDWRDPQKRQEWIMKRLDWGLHLTGEQKEKITAILQKAAPQMEAIRGEVRPRLDAVRQQVRVQIRPLLTPKQQTKYDQMEAEWQERRGSFRPGP